MFETKGKYNFKWTAKHDILHCDFVYITKNQKDPIDSLIISSKSTNLGSLLVWSIQMYQKGKTLAMILEK